MMLFNRLRIFSSVVSSAILFTANAQAQQIAILDSGVDNPDDVYNIVEGFNYFNNTDDTSDISIREGEGHGTVSVRVATEAFSGEIIPFVVADGADIFTAESAAARDSSLSDILGRSDVRVVAMTIGAVGIDNTSAPLIANLSNDDKIIAISAGNNISSQPNVLSTSSFNLDGVIIVGGTDIDGNLLPAANRAGTTENKYVAAVGMPTLTGDFDDDEGGSSWATARIAGIAGAVLLQNPSLTNKEVLDIIFLSAEDRGDVGVDSEYGHGVILNAQQVLNNVIGEVEIPTAPTDSGGGGGGGGGGLILGAALAGGLFLLTRPKTTLEKTLVLDSYGRAFEVDLTKQISVNDETLHLNNFFLSLEQKTINDGFVLPALNTQVAFSVAADTDHRLDMVEYFAMPGDVVIENDSAQLSFALESQLSSKIRLAAGYKVSPSQAFGAGASIISHETFGSSSFISGQSFSSVLSGFSEQAEAASLSYAHGKKGKFFSKLGFVSVDQSQDFGQNSFSSILEGKYKFNDAAEVSVQFGQIEEKGSVLGGSAGGVFGVETSETYAVNVAGRVEATDKLSIVANYGVGRTSVDASANSLLNGFSKLNSNWYSIGLIGNDVFRAKDQFGLAFSQPLKIVSGSVDYSIPTGQDINYDIVFNSERVDLSATQATEYATEAYYRTMVSDKLELGSFISYRQNPNHVDELGNDLLFMATLQFRQ